MPGVAVGMFPPNNLLAGDPDRVRALLSEIHAAGLDHVATGDHVSFFVGVGIDGLVSATQLLTANPDLDVLVSVYVLALRHPVLVARQLSTISSIAPGRLVLGVGVGGEDRHEIEICGVDPSTRGRRMDECLAALRLLTSGGPVDFDGEFFSFEGATVIPRPDPAPAILVGGRSSAAVRRAAEHGDGWIATWVSSERFGAATAEIAERAADAGRGRVDWRHGLQAWCGFADDRETARSAVANSMQALYRLPFEKFEKYSPFGTPQDVAEALAPYVDAGCTTLNLLPQAADPALAIESVAEVKRLLNEHAGAGDGAEGTAGG